MEFSEDDASGIIRKLESPCWQCDRRGKRTLTSPSNWIGEDDDSDTCGICHGKGWRLTKAGEHLQDFIKRWAS